MKKLVWVSCILLSLTGCVASEYVKEGANTLGLSDMYDSATAMVNNTSTEDSSASTTSTSEKSNNKINKQVEGLDYPLEGYEELTYNGGYEWSSEYFDITRRGQYINKETGTIYDKNGFDERGDYRSDRKDVDRGGFITTVGIHIGTKTKYDWDGYDIAGYDKNGLDWKGNYKTGKYDGQGYDKLGWNESKSKHKSGKSINDKPTVKIQSWVKDTNVHYAVLAAYGGSSVPVSGNTVRFEYKDLKVNGKSIAPMNGTYNYSVKIGNPNTLTYTVIVYNKDNNGKIYADSKYTKEENLIYKDLYTWTEKTNDTTLSLESGKALSAY